MSDRYEVHATIRPGERRIEPLKFDTLDEAVAERKAIRAEHPNWDVHPVYDRERLMWLDSPDNPEAFDRACETKT